jgi:hypothetical protein
MRLRAARGGDSGAPGPRTRSYRLRK